MFHRVHESFANLVIKIVLLIGGCVALLHLFNILYDRIPHIPPPRLKSAHTAPAPAKDPETDSGIQFHVITKPAVNIIQPAPVYKEKPLIDFDGKPVVAE